MDKYVITEALRKIGQESLEKFGKEDQIKIKKLAKILEDNLNTDSQT